MRESQPRLRLQRGGQPRRPAREPGVGIEPQKPYIVEVQRPAKGFEVGDLILVAPDDLARPLVLTRDLDLGRLARLELDDLRPFTSGPMPDLLTRSLRRPPLLRLVHSA